MSDEQIAPQHIGFIMDGNRRWAKARGLNTSEGHRAGQATLHDIVFHAVERGVKYISAYAFSTENWSRTKKEVKYLMGQVAKALTKYADELIQHGIRVIVLGSRDNLPPKVADSIIEIERRTCSGDRATFAICFNYGGQLEIADACKKIVQKAVQPEDITPETIAEYMYYPELPPLDVVVRTSGEQRLSGFMLWRAAYSEFIFRDEMWPDFSIDALDECLLEYSKRQRRFGG